ncbi:MAG: hypothetical protein ACFN04_07845 [Propionibacterium acidifaciens]
MSALVNVLVAVLLVASAVAAGWLFWLGRRQSTRRPGDPGRDGPAED